MLCLTWHHHRCESNLSNGSIQLQQQQKVFTEVPRFGNRKRCSIHSVLTPELDSTTNSVSDNDERTEYTVGFTEGQIKRTATPLGAGASPRDEERCGNGRRGGGQAFTLNDWDRPGRNIACGGEGGKGQTKMLKEEREMENDACALDDMGANCKSSEGPNTGQWINTSWRQ